MSDHGLIPEQKFPVNIEDEMRRSYLDYAMSVIIGRALPDIRDGLKPVHRRVLYAMFREGLLSSRRYSKCAGVVGEVLKKYHPHGDAAVYDSLVRLVQPWNMRYPLIDGQGNFGSIDGDAPAAYRYTECRLEKLAEELLREDIDKQTVDWVPNFDGEEKEPTVLPAKYPNLLVNGSSGIAVGMATNIPPHNLGEIVDGVVHLIDNPDTSIQDLMKIIPGPDFPTAGFIHGREGIASAYTTGRGIIQLRARAIIEKHKGDRESIVVREIPYQVNKAKLIERIAELVKDKKIDSISGLKDESDRDGMRVVVELKRGEVAAVVLNNLFALTQMQSTFGIIFLAIVDGQPKVCNLKELLHYFLDHRKAVVIRRTRFDLRRAEERAHILEGFKIALDHLDAVIALIRAAKTPVEARSGLISEYRLSEPQAQAILEMRLQRLTGMERQKILDELVEIQTEIARYKEILSKESLVLQIIKEELAEIKRLYADPRRTEIIASTQDISIEDLIAEEEMVVTVSRGGYIKRSPLTLYRAQRRGGKGKIGMTTKEEDIVEHLFAASTHSYVLVFTSNGRVYWLKVHEIPQIGVAGRGKAIVNLLNISSDDRVAALLSVKEFSSDKSLIFATKQGKVKKSELSAYGNPRPGGIIALRLEEGDDLLSVRVTDGECFIFLGTYHGKAIRFLESDVRSMGRDSAGVRGITLAKGDYVVEMETVKPGNQILTVTERGYGKRTEITEYRQQYRGGTGVINIKITDKNKQVAGIKAVTDDDQILVITQNGMVIRILVSGVSVISRSTQGVKLMNLEEGDKVVAVAKLAERDEDTAGTEEPAPPSLIN